MLKVGIMGTLNATSFRISIADENEAASYEWASSPTTKTGFPSRSTKIKRVPIAIAKGFQSF
ncbi:MAG: hypothetical protein HQK52_23450 [Oligoflexia bacterium]|nr:hypothetical protein [Oligoflexia bacterium]